MDEDAVRSEIVLRMDKMHSVVFLLVLVLTCPGRLGMAHAKDVSTIDSIDRRAEQEISDPCEDPSLSPALRDALSLVCSRPRVDDKNQRIRKAIIFGFVGGFVKPNDTKHPEVLFATHVQNRYGAGVHVGIFGNHEGTKAIEDLTLFLDKNKDRFLSADEKEQAKIILFGHSWGASQVLSFARELQTRGIPVALTIQVDSVKKFGQNDHTVPANVARAVNFYQRKGFTPGQSLIVPADATRTNILGNFQMKYESHQVNCDNYRWLSRVFNKAHHQIENDPQIWDKIASLIDSEVLSTEVEGQSVSSTACGRYFKRSKVAKN
jgi:hypothetical protein